MKSGAPPGATAIGQDRRVAIPPAGAGGFTGADGGVHSAVTGVPQFRQLLILVKHVAINAILAVGMSSSF